MSTSDYSTRKQACDATPAVELSAVSKVFGPSVALRDATADFAQGKLHVIVGENGAGKSTLLRIIAGLMKPTRGRVAVFGSADLREMAERIGYMPHAPLLYDQLSGLENLRYTACLYGIDDERRCHDVIEAVQLDPKLRRRVGQYSQGMRQRLSLARAIVHDPALLLLDEPFSNVDPGSAQHMVDALATLRDAGRTVVLITHQPALLDGVADNYVSMEAGRITDQGGSAPARSAQFTSTVSLRMEWRSDDL
ncbi:MAG TPA: ABC transporter ATP-binding protein [Terriglobales bacterium]|nr:ABC transporter ATP-binding protein [Terriglobales bacterium]